MSVVGRCPLNGGIRFSELSVAVKCPVYGGSHCSVVDNMKGVHHDREVSFVGKCPF